MRRNSGSFRSSSRAPVAQQQQPRQYQPTAQLAMLHRRSAPSTPMAGARTTTTTRTSYREPADDPACIPGADTNVASLYTGGSPPRQQQPPSPPSPVLRDEREIDPVQEGALQFVPAFCKADAKDPHPRTNKGSRSRRRSHEQTSWEGASWDALLAEEEKKESSDVAVPRARSAIHYTSSTTTGRRSPFLPQRGSKDASSNSSHNKQQPSSPGNRMARIKSIFHHRASHSRAASEAGAATHNNNSFAAAPPSPAHSGSGSSAYVGWPGTQDKAGKVIATVATSSSYEDSSTAGPTPGRQQQQQQQQHDVHNSLSKEGSRTQDTSRWTAQTSACTEDGDDDDLSTAGGFPSSPIRQSNLDQSSFSSFPDDPADTFHPQSAAEFHLAAAVADAKAAARSADRDRSSVPTTTRRSSESDILSRAIPLTRTKVSLSHSAALSQQSNKRGPSPTVVGDQNVSPKPNLLFSSDPFAEWDAAESPALSKSSSAYFNAREVSKMQLGYPDLSPSPPSPTRNSEDPVNLDDSPPSPGDDDSPQDGFHPVARQRSPAYAPYNSRHQKEAAAAAANELRGRQQQPQRPRSQPPTEDALQQLSSPPHFNFATPTSKGFRGLLDKTKEVPSLMDNLDSDASLSSSKATSVSGTQSNSGGKGGGAGGVSRNHREFLRNMYDIDADAQTVSDVFDGISVSKESDVFDNLSLGDRSSPRNKLFTAGQQRHRAAYPERIAEEDDTNLNSSRDSNNQNEGFNLVVLGGGLTAIQTTEEDFQRRQTASDYDDCNLTNSDVSSNGYAKIPGYHQMLSAGKGGDSSLRGIHGNLGANQRAPRGAAQQQRSAAGSAKQPHFGSWPPPEQEMSSDFRSSGSSTSSKSEFSLFSDPYQSDSGLDVEGDLSEFYIHPSLMKKVLRKYRKFSEQDTSTLGLADFERCEDERKVFALFEMRSRIMEKDIERGLERRGGTSVVDDLVLTPYNRTAHRVRDAVIVSKAWRDGATMSDVINSALLTRRAEHSFFIRRPVVRPNERAGRDSRYTHSVQRYTWEARKWVDDADFMQYRCPSLGSRHMWGFELFTIGDCQSMLLKLTNERCLELRQELNSAMARQIAAEDALSQEGESFDFGEMTEAESTYLESMEEVKVISKKLVGAEQAFALVRDRIEKLISRYQSILLKIETDNFEGESSVCTYESSYYSGYEGSEYWKEQEQIWAKRAQRAEIKAEIAAREAAIAKKEARMVKEEKIREIEILQKKLDELQSVSSADAEEKEKAAAAQTMAIRQATLPATNGNAPSLIQSTTQLSKEKLDDVKKRFRDRMSAKKYQNQQEQLQQQAMATAGRVPLYPSAPTRNVRRTLQSQAERELIMSAGEEMCQQMDFYERSLKAVDTARGI